MGRKRLSALSLMAIESELVRDLDFEDLICNIVRKRARERSSKGDSHYAFCELGKPISTTVIVPPDYE